MKEYLDKIVAMGKKEDMDCLGDMLIDLMYHVKECDHDTYTKYKNKIVGMAYNYTINEELAHEIVEDMRPLGEYWDMDTIKSVVGEVNNLPEVYVVMNSLANDYGKVISLENVETYVGLTKSWLNDEDGHKNKAWWYFTK